MFQQCQYQSSMYTDSALVELIKKLSVTRRLDIKYIHCMSRDTKKAIVALSCFCFKSSQLEI